MEAVIFTPKTKEDLKLFQQLAKQRTKFNLNQTALSGSSPG